MSIISQAQEYRATLALLLVGTLAGFLAGRLSSIPNAPEPAPTAQVATEPKEATPTPSNSAKEKDKAPIQTTTDSDWEDEAQGELSDFSGMNEECKLVLVVRTDLGMTKGILDTSI
jgi:hypothetical protein